MAARAPVESQSTALVRYEPEKPRGLLGRLRGAMEKWTLQKGGKALGARPARLVAPQNEYGVDPFGLDLEFAKAAVAPALWLYKNWFRVETHGIEHVPAGRALIIANHSGQLPFDALMIGISMLVEAEPPRICRAMVEKWAPIVPVAAVGAEEQAPALWDFKAAAKILGFPSLPVTPTLLPLPLPVKYRLHFGAPMKFTGSADDEDAELERKVKEVKARMQAMLNRGVEERQAIFF